MKSQQIYTDIYYISISNVVLVSLISLCHQFSRADVSHKIKKNQGNIYLDTTNP